MLPRLASKDPDLASAPPAMGPLVSVVVPARNEAANIATVLETLRRSTYQPLEILVVDDRSSDETGLIAGRIAAADDRIRVIAGEEVPAGWFGKPWACQQGYRAARGDLLLFTDADTRHDDELLGHAVGAFRHPGVGLVSTMPRQLMEGFWERVVLPHIFTMLALRYRDARRINRTSNPRQVLANGQFILMPRAVYDAVGGHSAVRGDVVEDLRLAQRVVANGQRIYLAHAEDLMDTRMYRSLGAIVEGWSKNLAIGMRGTVAPWLQPALPWLVGLLTIAFWTVPPAVLALSLFAPVGPAVASWALTTCVVSLAFWTYIDARMRVPLLHAAFFPLGGLIAGGLFLRSAAKGQRIRWKGRSYDLEADAAG
jgi:chlorobactene glucosyltransferase